ncbi:hypothetical protein LZC95_21640 [Pendulispora brunnea]|uniref:PH domain-containing protein n=1 Tax=Pendulispora brunnea TaxID=2905690 RepID=A0ABZ2KSY0_9BACT
MHRFSYARRHYCVSLVGQDALLAAVFVALLEWTPEGTLGSVAVALRVAIPLVLAWGALTLHFPSQIELDDSTLTFRRYGRRHSFDMHEVASIRVRRFLVRDRVLVRIAPAPPWQGRYWLLRDLEGFEELVGKLEALGNQKRISHEGGKAGRG